MRPLGLMSKGFTAYVLHFSGYTLVYGAFASLPVFLLWIYLSWLVVVSGAVVAASLPYWRGGMWRIERTAGRRYLDALCVLQALCRGQYRGEALSLVALQRETRVTPEELESILRQLRDAHWVARTAGQGCCQPTRGILQCWRCFASFCSTPGRSCQLAAMQDLWN